MSKPELTKEQILAMNPWELDRHIYEIFFEGDLTGFVSKGSSYGQPQLTQYVKVHDTGVTWVDVPKYSTNISAAWEVEEQIKKLGLNVEYTAALKQVVLGTGEYVGMFDFIHATPEQRCKAALLAVMDK